MILNIYLRINPYLHYIEAFWLAQVSINKTNKYLISVDAAVTRQTTNSRERVAGNSRRKPFNLTQNLEIIGERVVTCAVCFRLCKRGFRKCISQQKPVLSGSCLPPFRSSCCHL